MINSVAQFVKIMHYVFEEFTFHICNQFFNDIKVKKSKINYKEVKILFSIQQFMLEHI